MDAFYDVMDADPQFKDIRAMHPEDLYNGAVPKPIAMSIASLPSRLMGLQCDAGSVE